jgi:hypothetical protein
MCFNRVGFFRYFRSLDSTWNNFNNPKGHNFRATWINVKVEGIIWLASVWRSGFMYLDSTGLLEGVTDCDQCIKIQYEFQYAVSSFLASFDVTVWVLSSTRSKVISCIYILAKIDGPSLVGRKQPIQCTPLTELLPFPPLSHFTSPHLPCR